MSFINFYQSHIESIKKSLDNLNLKDVENLIDTIISCEGKIIFTGIGKNGHVAAKSTSTFCSIGVHAFFLNPVDSVHGDMGVVSDKDVIISVSKSGNTEELLVFLKNVRRKKCKIISIHSNNNNQSLQYSDHDVNLHVDREADDLNIVPTSSIAIFTVFLQSVACEISRRKELTLEEFVFNHPGGSIGKLK